MNIAELKTWLEADGFRIAPDRHTWYQRDDGWYAYRRSSIPARECETNDGKPAQIIVYPYPSFNAAGSDDVEVELCGEAGGIWWKLRGIGIAVDDLPAKLPAVEAGLVAAWNALLPDAGIEKATEG